MYTEFNSNRCRLLPLHLIGSETTVSEPIKCKENKEINLSLFYNTPKSQVTDSV